MHEKIIWYYASWIHILLKLQRLGIETKWCLNIGWLSFVTEKITKPQLCLKDFTLKFEQVNHFHKQRLWKPQNLYSDPEKLKNRKNFQPSSEFPFVIELKRKTMQNLYWNEAFKHPPETENDFRNWNYSLRKLRLIEQCSLQQKILIKIVETDRYTKGCCGIWKWKALRMKCKIQGLRKMVI